MSWTAAIGRTSTAIRPFDPLRWLPDLSVALMVLAAGAVEYVTGNGLDLSHQGLLSVLDVAGTAVATGLVRRAPAVALALAWLVPLCQAATGTTVMTVQLAVVAVAFGAARWGSTATLWASGVSIPAGAVSAMLLIDSGIVTMNLPASSWRLVIRSIAQLGTGWRAGVVVVLVALLGAPWLAGLVLRTADRARVDVDRAAREAARAEETSRIRDAQTRLARDVHDVVGHSLAVILAQAESGQYLPDDDPARLKAALATIATSARTSLGDVRDVLSATRDGTEDLDSLIDNLRAAGHDVVSTEIGTPRPLTAELRATAYRVLQEMLTNAIRHGRRGSAVLVQRSWFDGLIIEVRNAFDTPPAAPGGKAPGQQEPGREAPSPVLPAQEAPGHGLPGHGLSGMRERLAAAGGTLTTERRDEVFVASARIPVP
jgi:signal transduction histidine kinase